MTNYKIQEIEKSFDGKILENLGDNEYIIKINDNEHKLKIINTAKVLITINRLAFVKEISKPPIFNSKYLAISN